MHNDRNSMRPRVQQRPSSLTIRTDRSPSDMAASPTAQYFKNRLASQVRRVAPMYIILVLLLVIIVNVNLVPSKSSHVHEGVRSFHNNVKQQYKRQASKGGNFPRKIWQTWKTHPLNFEERDRDTARTWPEKNPEYRYEVLTDFNEMAYLEEHFGPRKLNRPDLVELYRSITANIIKADLLRYMIMYAEGGVYADIDVEDLRPIHRFIPDRYPESDIDMVLGIEIDQPDFKDHPILGIKSMSFCQWVFMCKPGLPVMMRLIESIKFWLEDLSRKQKKPIPELHIDFDDVISGSGPSAYTRAILEQMNAERGPNGREVTWNDFHDIPGDSVLVNGFLVLNVEAFAAGQGHSDSGNHDSRFAMVKHHYHASGWPSRHGRKLHPMYGEVERCNWNHDCVNEWDRNVAEFEALSQDEKDRKIANAPPPVELFREQVSTRPQDLSYVDGAVPAPPPKEGDDDHNNENNNNNNDEKKEGEQQGDAKLVEGDGHHEMKL